jgi:phosphoribosylformylglycinamidine cyclo-ligase
MPEPPPIFGLIQEYGVKTDEMYKTFNMGIGFCVVASKDQVDKIKSIFKKHNISSQEIGQITSKIGVFVNSTKIA